MHCSHSVSILVGVVALALTLGLSQGRLCAQQKGVRTIKDFPNRLTKEVQHERVPRQENGVRTAADYERAAIAEAAELEQLEANAPPPVAANLSVEEKEKDTTSYVFSIPGADLVRVATQAGAVFSPDGGRPVERGGNAAFQMPVHPKAVTSLAQGHIMTQFKPQDFWVIESSKNRFRMFMDSKGNPLQLREGWSVQGVVLKGKNYNWVTQPEPGARSPFFAVEITAYHHADTIVEIAGAHLTGPPGATEWEQAFVTPKDANERPGTPGKSRSRKTTATAAKAAPSKTPGPRATGL